MMEIIQREIKQRIHEERMQELQNTYSDNSLLLLLKEKINKLCVGREAY